VLRNRLSDSFIVCVLTIAATICVSLAGSRGITNTSSSPYVKLRSVDIDDVQWTKGFWAEKFDLCNEVMVPNMWGLLSDPNVGHALQNFRIAAGLEEGPFKGTWWHDGDFYKWIEAASYVYAVTKNSELDSLMDEAVDVIGKAQQPDGYISTAVITGYKGAKKRFEIVGHHELYNMGHLMTAACIHYRATGKTSFLDIAKKTGDYLYETFKPRPAELAHFGFNPSNIMGAAELYRTTNNPKYLELARIFVAMRGSRRGGSDQNQARIPLRQETEAVGHAVTANYLYAGAADVYAETGDEKLLSALEEIWSDVTLGKMSVTGGTGALHQGVSRARDQVHESYGREHQLPNATVYNETCANIANGMWNWRMLAVTADARFADVLELVLYNSALSGISIDGKHFFYTNVLRRTKDTPFLSWDLPTRQAYLNCFCCPPNIVRTIAKLRGWAYSTSDRGVWVNLYGSNVLDTELADGTSLRLSQETDYPWDGKIVITVDAPDKKEFSIMLRIPEWAEDATLKVNGGRVESDLTPGRYFELRRTWSGGERIELDLPMRIRLIEANPLVEETRNQIAVKRGPIVYCLESADLPNSVRVSEVIIPADIELKAEFEKNLLGGVTVLNGQAWAVQEKGWEGALYRERQSRARRKVNIRLIPYYAWSNRGVSEMTVWMPLGQ